MELVFLISPQSKVLDFVKEFQPIMTVVKKKKIKYDLPFCYSIIYLLYVFSLFFYDRKCQKKAVVLLFISRKEISTFSPSNSKFVCFILQEVPKECSSEDEKEASTAFNPFMPSNLLQEHKTESGNSVSTATTAESAKATPNFEFPAKNNDTIPLNLSKPRRSEEPNNNKEQDITPLAPSGKKS